MRVTCAEAVKQFFGAINSRAQLLKVSVCSETFLQPANTAAIYNGVHWVINYFTDSTSPLITEKRGGYTSTVHGEKM